MKICFFPVLFLFRNMPKSIKGDELELMPPPPPEIFEDGTGKSDYSISALTDKIEEIDFKADIEKPTKEKTKSKEEINSEIDSLDYMPEVKKGFFDKLAGIFKKKEVKAEMSQREGYFDKLLHFLEEAKENREINKLKKEVNSLKREKNNKEEEFNKIIESLKKEKENTVLKLKSQLDNLKVRKEAVETKPVGDLKKVQKVRKTPKMKGPGKLKLPEKKASAEEHWEKAKKEMENIDRLKKELESLEKDDKHEEPEIEIRKADLKLPKKRSLFYKWGRARKEIKGIKTKEKEVTKRLEEPIKLRKDDVKKGFIGKLFSHGKDDEGAEIQRAIQEAKSEHILKKEIDTFKTKADLLPQSRVFTSSDVGEIWKKINEARDAIADIRIDEAKRAYIEIMKLYNFLSPKDKAQVYNDILDLYDERKSAEKLFAV